MNLKQVLKEFYERNYGNMLDSAIEKYLEEYNLTKDEYVDLIIDISIYLWKNDMKDIYDFNKDESPLYKEFISYYDLYDIVYDFQLTEDITDSFLKRIPRKLKELI